MDKCWGLDNKWGMEFLDNELEVERVEDQSKANFGRVIITGCCMQSWSPYTYRQLTLSLSISTVFQRQLLMTNGSPPFENEDRVRAAVSKIEIP